MTRHRLRSFRLVEELVDVVAVVDKANVDLNFLDAWKHALGRTLVILILERGLYPADVSIPTWLNYDLFSYDDVKKTFGSLTSDVVHFRGPSLRNFGLWVSDKEYVLFIGVNTHHLSLPIASGKRKSSLHEDWSLRPQLPKGFLQDHLLSLNTPPSDKSFYNCTHAFNSRQQKQKQQQHLNLAAHQHRSSLCQPQYPGLGTYTGISVAYPLCSSISAPSLLLSQTRGGITLGSMNITATATAKMKSSYDKAQPAQVRCDDFVMSRTEKMFLADMKSFSSQQGGHLNNKSSDVHVLKQSYTQALRHAKGYSPLLSSISIPRNTVLNISAADSILVNRALLGLAMFHLPFPGSDHSADFYDTFSFMNNMLRVVMNHTNIGARYSWPYKMHRNNNSSVAGAPHDPQSQSSISRCCINMTPSTGDHKGDTGKPTFMQLKQVSEFFRTVELLDNTLTLSDPWSNPRRHMCPGRSFNEKFGRYHQQIECALLMLGKQVTLRLADVSIPVTGSNGGSGGKEKKGDQQKGSVQHVFRHVEKAIQSWTYLWANRHWDGINQNMWGHTKLFAVASRSSMGPKTASTTCALLTMVHNEKDLLPLWLRYYTKTFDPRDMFLFDHFSDDNSTHPSKLPPGINYEVPFDLPKDAMPIFYRSHIVMKYQEKLLRAGYKCVIFTDIDEFIVPNPKKYPGGLKEYLNRFVADPSRLYHRVNGWEPGHVYYGNGSKGSGEPDFNWTDPYIFHQRKYYVPAPMYSKPILTKTPLQYRPGFHNLVDKGIVVPQDLDLVMLHMTSFDNNYCLYRAELHYNLSQKMAKNEAVGGFATHWERYHYYKRKGLLCQYANGCYLGPMTPTTQVMDNSGVFPLQLVPDDFRDVQL
jgi:hypothetical protein